VFVIKDGLIDVLVEIEGTAALTAAPFGTEKFRKRRLRRDNVLE
jgi:hypothetical protein